MRELDENQAEIIEREKEEAENKRNAYKETVKKAYDLKAVKYDRLMSVLGPKGKLHEGTPNKAEYDAIEIDVPEGLSEEQVMAIIIGSMMRPDRLGRSLTGSSFPPGTSTFEDFNSSYILQNVADKNEISRIGEMPMVLTEARKEAQKAIEAYKNNDPEPVKALLNNYMDYYARNSADIAYSSVGTGIYKQSGPGELLAGELFGKEPFNMVGSQPEIATTRAKAKAVTGNLVMDVTDLKNTLIDNAPAPSSDERKKVVFDLLFDQYVVAMSQVNLSDRYTASSVEFYPLLDEIRKKHFGGKGKNLQSEQRVMGAITDAQRNTDKTTISDIEVILARPDGIEQLKEAYRAEIEHTEIYERLVAATGDDIVTAMMDADELTQKGITSFKDVQLEEAAKEMNERAKAVHDNNLKAIEQKVVDLVKENRYGIIDMDNKNLTRNATLIDSFKTTLINNTSFWKGGSSKNYDNFQKSIEELDKYAQTLAQAGIAPTADQVEQYIALAREADRLAGVYLDNKTNISSTYAQNRVAGVKDIREKLKINIKSMERNVDVLEEKEVKNINSYNKDREDEMKKYETRVNNYKNYALDHTRAKEAYCGNKYTPEQAANIPRGGYSVQRTALYSITMMALAAEVDEKGNPKYTFDELTDPEKISDARQKMFDEVVKNVSKTAVDGPDKDAANKWIAQKIYKGHDVTVKMMDEQMNTMSFSEPSCFNTVQFAKMMTMGAAQFDVAQEVAHCSKEIVELAKKDNPEINTVVDYQVYLGKLEGPIGTMGQSLAKLIVNDQAYQRKKNNGEKYEGQATFIADAINWQLHANTLAEWSSLGNSKGAFSKWHVQSGKWKVTEKIMNIAKSEAAMNLDMSGSKSSKAFDTFHDDLLTGALMCDARLEVNPEVIELSTIHGIPNADKLIEDYDALNIDEKDIRKDCARLFKELTEKREKAPNEIMIKYIDKAINSLTRISDDFINGVVLTDTMKNSNLKGYLSSMVELKLAEKYSNDGISTEDGALEGAVEAALNANEEFQKDIEYLGFGTLNRYIFKDEASKMVDNAPQAYEIGKEYAPIHVAKNVLYDNWNDLKDRDVKVKMNDDPNALRELIKAKFIEKTLVDAKKNWPEGKKKFDDEELSMLKNVVKDFDKTVLKGLTDEMQDNPESVRMIYAKLKNNTLLEGVKFDYKAPKTTFEGLEEFTELKDNLSMGNSLKESQKAMERLEAGAYRKKSDYIKDAALVVAAKVYEATGKLPVKRETGQPISIKEYAGMLANSQDFVGSISSKKADGKLINPKAFAKSMKDPNVVKTMIAGANQTAQRRRSASNTRRNEIKNNISNKPEQIKRSNTMTGLGGR